MSHPPLPVVKAWLPIPSPASTVADLATSVSALLGGVQVELELDGAYGLCSKAGEESRLTCGVGAGFALLLQSPCAMLDPVRPSLRLDI